ncbi:MAG TPA: UDP-N-acetylglucosamine 1-carboxyvinyltransferase [Planctomycetes bacterium]|nr:UDP-N-acetylglucosamine 1-carboxyvinyltransferase [Planctomycetota bacterium]
MDRLVIEGGRPLEGTVPTAGAKNAVLSLLTAALLTEEEVRIENVPDLVDVHTMIGILEGLGGEVSFEPGGVVRAKVGAIHDPVAPWDLVRKMRASFEVLGPLVARCGRARVSYPGGCVLGLRPVDVHIKGLEALGARITTEGGDVVAEAPRGGLVGAEIYLGTASGSSVGATRNVLMAAVLAKGTSVLEGVACEPEIVDLAQCLIKMGAKILGAGSPTIVVEGVERLEGTCHRVIPDRIEAGTYITAGAITGGRVRVTGCRPEHLSSFLEALRAAGCPFERGEDWVETQPRGSADRLQATDVTTQPHPGFPTDLQAQWVSLMTLADGISLVTERIFSERYMHLSELLRLGAHVRRQNQTAIVEGIEGLSGAHLTANDLRGSAALVLAGLVATGTTEVHRVYHIDRGYERIEERLRALGANIRRESGD